MTKKVLTTAEALRRPSPRRLAGVRCTGNGHYPSRHCGGGPKTGVGNAGLNLLRRRLFEPTAFYGPAREHDFWFQWLAICWQWTDQREQLVQACREATQMNLAQTGLKDLLGGQAYSRSFHIFATVVQRLAAQQELSIQEYLQIDGADLLGIVAAQTEFLGSLSAVRSTYEAMNYALMAWDKQLCDTAILCGWLGLPYQQLESARQSLRIARVDYLNETASGQGLQHMGRFVDAEWLFRHTGTSDVGATGLQNLRDHLLHKLITLPSKSLEHVASKVDPSRYWTLSECIHTVASVVGFAERNNLLTESLRHDAACFLTKVSHDLRAALSTCTWSDERAGRLLEDIQRTLELAHTLSAEGPTAGQSTATPLVSTLALLLDATDGRVASNNSQAAYETLFVASHWYNDLPKPAMTDRLKSAAEGLLEALGRAIKQAFAKEAFLGVAANLGGGSSHLNPPESGFVGCFAFLYFQALGVAQRHGLPLPAGLNELLADAGRRNSPPARLSLWLDCTQMVNVHPEKVLLHQLRALELPHGGRLAEDELLEFLAFAGRTHSLEAMETVVCDTAFRWTPPEAQPRTAEAIALTVLLTISDFNPTTALL